MDTDMVNIKSVSLSLCLYVLSNNSCLISQVQFMKKLSNTEDKLKRIVAFKKTRI